MVIDCRGGMMIVAPRQRCKRFLDCRCERPCCTDRLATAFRRPHVFSLGDADGLRASKLKHVVQGIDGNGDLCPATPIHP
jgi:hypothetical protein